MKLLFINLCHLFIEKVKHPLSKSANFITGIALILLSSSFSLDLSATVRYVKSGSSGSAPYTTWATADGNLQTVIDYSSAGDTIWVAAGTYLPALNTSFAMKEGVKIFGGFTGTETNISQRDWEANVTILKGNGKSVINNNNNGLSNAAELDGFTIRDGNGSFMGGGGIFNYRVSPVIRNCSFSNNTTSWGYGGGIYNSDGSPVITNCIFSGNSTPFREGGAIYHEGSGSPLISNCTFLNNTAETGGAISLQAGSPIVLNCILQGNSAMEGGAVFNYCSSLFINCVFNDNTANGRGSAIWNRRSSTLINCTLTDNNSTNSVIAIENLSTVQIRNSIIYGNNGNITITPGSSLIAANSLIQGIHDNTNGNIDGDTDPLFVNAGDVDGADDTWGTNDDGLILQSSSPAMNSGDNSYISGYSEDVGGDPRIFDCTVDMGAYETQVLTFDPQQSVVQDPVPVCSGTDATFTVSHQAGTNPTFTWYLNGTQVQTGSSNTYVTDSLVDGDDIIVEGVYEECSNLFIDTIVGRVLSQPVLNSIGNFDYCNGEGADAIQFTGSFSNVDWTNDQVGIGLAASGSGDINPFTATNNTNAPIVAHIQAIGSTSTVGDPRIMDYGGRRVTYSNIKINGGANEASVAPASTVNLSFDAVSVFTGYCPGCVYQQYIGIGGSNTTIHCFSSFGSSTQYYSGNDNFTAPTTPGIYYLTFNGSLQYNCIPMSFNNEPENAIAILYVGVPMPSISCTDTINFTITVNPTPDATATPSTQTICSGAVIQTIALTGNVAGTTFDWTRDNTSNLTGIATSGSGDISGALTNTTNTIQTTIFTITPTANGCTGTPITATVTVNPTPDATVTPSTQTICSGAVIQSIALTGSVAGTTFDWTRDNTSNLTGIAASGSGDITGALTNTTNTIQTTTFTITPTANGCTGTSITAIVTVNPTPDATAAPSAQTICSEDVLQTIALTGNVAGTTFDWTRDNTSNLTGIAASGNGDISGNLTNTTNTIQTTTFTITPTANGCTGTPITATVTVNPTPDATATPSAQTICSEDVIQTIALAGNVAGTTFDWTRDNTGNVTGIAASGSGDITGALINTTNTIQTTTFTITPTANGCTGTSITAIVTVNPTPDATATPSAQTICSGSTIQNIALTGSVSGTTYSWTRNNTVNVTGIPASGNGSIISGTLTNTTYTIQTVTFTITPTANGCVGAPITATVTVNPTPDVTPTPTDQEPCSGKPITPITMSGNVSGTTYLWTRDMPQITGIAMSGSGTISGTLYNNGSTPVTVTFTITPWANGCPGLPKTATVTVYPLPHAQAEAAPNPVCEGGLMWFNATGGVQYHWSGPGGFTFDGGRFGRNMELNMAGTYFVTVTSSHGCTSTASITVSVKPAPVPTISISPNPACTGNTVQLSATGGTGYKWSGPNGFTSTQQNPVITNVKLYQAGTYTVTVTGANSCTASISTDLKVNETPVGKAWYDEATSCAGSTLHLYATGGGTYQWTGPAGFSSTQKNPTRANLNSTHSGIYTVVITGLYGGCTSSYSVNVQVHPLPAVTAWTTTPEVCEGDAAYLFASGGSTYQWSGPYGYLSNFQNPVIYNIPAYMDGIYTVIASSKYGCTASASVYIDVQTVNAIVNATPNPVPYGGTLYLTASGGESYLWTGPNGFHTTFQNPIIYKFTSVNAGLYACVVSTRAGCQDTEIILVQVKDRGLQDEPQLETRTGKYVQVFPNPAKDMIRLVDHYTGTMNYTIIDAQGNAIQQGKTTSGDQISIDQLNAGSYYIQWTYTIDGKLQSNISKFIKVK